MADVYYPPEIEGDTDGDGFPPIRIAREVPGQSAHSSRRTTVTNDSESDQGSNNEEQDIDEDQLESDDPGIEKMTKHDLINEVFFPLSLLIHLLSHGAVADGHPTSKTLSSCPAW
jgi:hypothetical protein